MAQGQGSSESRREAHHPWQAKYQRCSKSSAEYLLRQYYLSYVTLANDQRFFPRCLSFPFIPLLYSGHLTIRFTFKDWIVLANKLPSEQHHPKKVVSAP